MSSSINEIRNYGPYSILQSSLEDYTGLKLMHTGTSDPDAAEFAVLTPTNLQLGRVLFRWSSIKSKWSPAMTYDMDLSFWNNLPYAV